MNRLMLYLAANLVFVALLAVGAASGPANGIHLLYLIPLFALCSSPILELKQLNGPYALLAVFSGIYFLFFGATDFFDLMSRQPQQFINHSAISAGEFVILIGAALVQLTYRLVARSPGTKRPPFAQDWPEPTIVLVGTILWLVTTWLSWRFKIYIVSDTTIEAQQHGLSSISSLKISIYVLAAYLQPLSILMLAYAQAKFRRFYMTPIIIGVVLVQFFMGFIEDSKGDELLGLFIVLLTKLFVSGKIPARWLLAGAVFIALAWPVMQANRQVRGQFGWDRIHVAEHVGEILHEAFAAKHEAMNGIVHAQSIFERLSLKGNVEMIVSRTGRDVRYQNGYTLTPILSAFIPKLLWSDKPDVPTGRIMNQEFQVVEQEETYISPSHLGELYWNFGWPGVLIGMTLFGFLLGFIGRLSDFSTTASLTRVMIAVATMTALCEGFESAIAPSYVGWMRSILAICLLHLLLAKESGSKQSTAVRNRVLLRPRQDSEGEPGSAPGPLFPNLMR